MVSILNEADKPLNDVKDIERDEKQFLLLGCMNALMIDDVFVDPTLVAGQYSSKQIQAIRFRHQWARDDNCFPFLFFRILLHE